MPHSGGPSRFAAEVSRPQLQQLKLACEYNPSPDAPQLPLKGRRIDTAPIKYQSRERQSFIAPPNAKPPHFVETNNEVRVWDREGLCEHRFGVASNRAVSKVDLI
jgi:hypothetical protein